ncbi:hypothetical protein [Sinorhizobium meliloti]|uniref:non-homologous end-joining DNA ligase LigD n=1 Tax=Rhizobium meliloti TaxID=382 RepID=UPI003D0F3681
MDRTCRSQRWWPPRAKCATDWTTRPRQFLYDTGGKGLHVLTPLAINKRKPLTWAAAKGFANDVCQEWPATIQTSISSRCQEPEGRADFPRLSSQRSHGDAVAPLSPRARPGAIICGSPG